MAGASTEGGGFFVMDAWERGKILFAEGRFWEAHEAWEELWLASDKSSSEGVVVRGLIQSAAACLKSEQGKARGVEILARRAAHTLRSAKVDRWREISVTALCRGLDGLTVGQRLFLQH